MNAFEQIMMFLLAAGFLGMAFLFWYRKKHHHGLICTVPAFIFVILAQLNSSGIPLFNLSLEQILCWFFGLLFFSLAVVFATKDKLAYAFIIFLISALSCFCGLSGVQALLKTHLLMTVTESLKGYGDKLDKYQNTVWEMQTNLTGQQSILMQQQSILSSNQDSLSKSVQDTSNSLSVVQGQIQDSQSKVLNQQSINQLLGDKLSSEQTNIGRISGQLTQQQLKMQIESVDILAQQEKLDSEQTNLNNQQQKIETVEATVGKLYSVLSTEEFDLSDTNRVFVEVQNPNLVIVFFKLKNVPVQNSLEAIATVNMQLSPHTPGLFDLPFLKIAKTALLGSENPTSWNNQFPIMILSSINNIAYGYFGVNQGGLPRDEHFFIRYARDEGNTNVINQIELKNNKLLINGNITFSISTNK